MASQATQTLLADCNRARYSPGQAAGHYESYYLRANHPSRALAFWIRYTLFKPPPADAARAAIGELWAIWFDGERHAHVAVKSEFPLGECTFARDRFDVAVGGARLDGSALAGSAASGGDRIEWDLRYAGGGAPVLMFQEKHYAGDFPKAKSLVARPLARFHGALRVNGEAIAIDDWVGSQNHNWGRQHTDHYFFGQVAGFDGAPDSFLECATARMRMGPFWTPWLTPFVLRHRGREYAVRSIPHALRTRSRTAYYEFAFAGRAAGARVAGTIRAPAAAFVGLTYFNPPGGVKHCLNTKIAACEVSLDDPAAGIRETLRAGNRALLEIMPPTDREAHGIPIRL